MFGNVRKRSSGLQNNFGKILGNLWKLFGNLRKIVKNLVISMLWKKNSISICTPVCIILFIESNKILVTDFLFQNDAR